MPRESAKKQRARKLGKRVKEAGARAERAVAKLFEEWWRALEPDVVFRRTPQSGGWAHAEQFDVSGDHVVSHGSAFPFCVEVKKRRAWSAETFVAGRACPVWGWWLQAQEAAAKSGREPLLVFRRPGRTPWMVLVRQEYAAELSVPPPVVTWGAITAEHGAMPVGFWLDALVKTEPRAWVLRV